jgi:hypothetical protein
MFSKGMIRFLSASVTGLLCIYGCSENPTGPDIQDGASKLFIVESDFQSGQLEWMSIRDTTISPSNLSVFSDAGIRSFGGYLYVIEHYGADNILKLDPSKSGQPGVQYQKHLGDNWNPTDIEFVSETKAYISNMNNSKITIFDPSTGIVNSSIDISAYIFRPDSNASPYANDLQLIGGDLYVLLQRRNGYNPGASSLILKIDTKTNTVIDTISLQYKNGYSMAYAGGALYISNPGSSYVTGDGAIEKVDLSTKAVNTIITETALGGNPNLIIHKNGSHFYVQNYIAWKDEKVIEIDASTGNVVAVLPNVKDAFGGIYYDDFEGKLYVGERDPAEMGVRIFKDNIQIGTTIKSSKGLPPTGLVIVQ